MKKTTKQMRLRLIFLPLILLSVWFLISLIYIFDTDFSPSTVSYKHWISDNKTTTEFGGENKYILEFEAKTDNLGIILLDFDQQTPVYGSVSFNFKEQGSSDWYSSTNHDAQHFYETNQYPFGFPLIKDSGGKKYVFEISYIPSDTSTNSTISVIDSHIATKYQHNINLLISSFPNAKDFVIQKSVYALSFWENKKRLAFFSIMILSIYSFINMKMTFKIIQSEDFEKWKSPSSYVFFLFLLLDIFVLSQNYDLFTLFGLSIWIYNIIKYKLETNDTFILVCLLFALEIIVIFLSSPAILEKIAIWIFYLMVTILVQSFIEYNRSIHE